MEVNRLDLIDFVKDNGNPQQNYTLGAIFAELKKLEKQQLMFKGAMSMLALTLMKTGEVRISKDDLMDSNNYQIIQEEDVATGEIVFHVKKIE